MKKTTVNTRSFPVIDYRQGYLFLGSCFSENLSEKMKSNGFAIESNPFGVVFNPISLAKFFLLTEDEIKATVFLREDVALSYLANSTCFAYEKEELQRKLVQLRDSFLTEISNSKMMFITFGTAWVYEHIESNRLVANCHKIPQKEFSKRLLTVEEIVAKWKKVIPLINEINPDLEIVFTLSPVRHTKDGLTENARSKAILLTAIHEIIEDNKKASYFPAYEIVIDELRNYAYYSTDGVHPNELAINEIWERFKITYFTEETKQINAEYIQLKQLLNHRLQHPESKASKAFVEDVQNRKEVFVNKYSFVKLESISPFREDKGE